MLKLSGKRALALGISILITIAVAIYAAPQPIVHMLRSIHVPVPKPLQEFATDRLVAQLEKEAEAGDCHAQYDLAVRLHQRQFPKKWFAIAMQADARKWLVRSAEGGCTDAMTELGRYADTAKIIEKQPSGTAKPRTLAILSQNGSWLRITKRGKERQEIWT